MALASLLEKGDESELKACYAQSLVGNGWKTDRFIVHGSEQFENPTNPPELELPSKVLTLRKGDKIGIFTTYNILERQGSISRVETYKEVVMGDTNRDVYQMYRPSKLEPGTQIMSRETFFITE